MSACDICKQPLIEGDVLCDSCRETITRLDAICHKQPELLGSAPTGQSVDAETGAAAAA